jgi:hypothetical protein
MKKKKQTHICSHSSFFTMPHCRFCGKLCTTASGLERHILYTLDCKKASSEEFNQYADSIWDDVPAKPNDAEQRQLVNDPNLPDPNLPDFHLEEDFQMAEDMLYNEEINLPAQPPHEEPPPHAQGIFETPNKEDLNNGGRFIEHFPEEYMAGATWGQGKPLFESLDEERKRAGASRWAPFEDEDEWELAEWLIRNVGQKQTDAFLKLPIVRFFPLTLSMYFINCHWQTQKRTKPTYGSNRNFLKKIDELPTQATGWTCDIVTSTGNKLNDEGEPVPSERLELWRRDPVECMKELMGNSIFEKSLEYAPQKHFLDNEAKNRVFDEMWTGDWWWDTQVYLYTCNFNMS